jgi:ABC-2 type transport system ATP-binding protein
MSDTPSTASVPDRNAAISVRDLVKIYGSGAKAKQALHGVSLDIARGSFFGLLGPNGAGKSTLINILAGLVRKTAGQAMVWGHDIDSDTRMARAAIGVVPQELNLDPFFTPEEALEFQAGLYGVPKAERRTAEILAAMGLTDKAQAYARTLSGGMRRRLLVAKALVHAPPVLVLDEPTAGVDIELRQQLWAYIRELNKSGVTVVLTTHYLEEAEALCDHIAIVNHGRIVAQGETPALLSKLDRKDVILTLGAELSAAPASLSSLSPELLGPRRLRLHYRPSATPFPRVLALVQAAGLEIIDLSTQEADLEDLFLELTSSRAA